MQAGYMQSSVRPRQWSVFYRGKGCEGAQGSEGEGLGQWERADTAAILMIGPKVNKREKKKGGPNDFQPLFLSRGVACMHTPGI